MQKELPVESSSSGKLNAEARAFVPTSTGHASNVSINGFSVPSYGIISYGPYSAPHYTPVSAEKRPLNPDAPEFVPANQPTQPIVPTEEAVVHPPNFVHTGGFRPQALEKRSQQPPVVEPPRQSYAAVAKVAPVKEEEPPVTPAAAPAKPAPTPTPAPANSTTNTSTTARLPSAAKGKTRAKQPRRPTPRTDQDEPSGRPPRSEVSTADSVQKRAPKKEAGRNREPKEPREQRAGPSTKEAPVAAPPAAAPAPAAVAAEVVAATPEVPAAAPAPAPTPTPAAETPAVVETSKETPAAVTSSPAEPTSPTRIAAKGVWGKGNSKNLFQPGQKILKAEPEVRPVHVEPPAKTAEAPAAAPKSAREGQRRGGTRTRDGGATGTSATKRERASAKASEGGATPVARSRAGEPPSAKRNLMEPSAKEKEKQQSTVTAEPSKKAAAPAAQKKEGIAGSKAPVVVEPPSSEPPAAEEKVAPPAAPAPVVKQEIAAPSSPPAPAAAPKEESGEKKKAPVESTTAAEKEPVVEKVEAAAAASPSVAVAAPLPVESSPPVDATSSVLESSQQEEEPSPVQVKEAEAPVAVDAAVAGEAPVSAPLLSVDEELTAEDRLLTPAAVPERRVGTAPLNFKDFKANAWTTTPRMPRVGVNSLFDAMRDGHKLHSLDTDAAAARSAKVASSSPTPSETQAAAAEESSEGCGPILSDHSRYGKLRYQVDDLLAVRNHKACTRLTKELKDSPYIQSILKREGPISRGLDIEAIYRNKGNAASGAASSISRANFSMPSALRNVTGGGPGSNIFESSEHIWSSKGGRPLSRDTHTSSSRPSPTEEWTRSQNPASRPAPPPPANLPPPELPEDSWQVKQKEQKSDGDRSVKLLRRLRAQLNKMTPATFDAIYEAVLGIGIETPEEAEQFVNLIFEKAITNHAYIQMYAEVCAKLEEDLSKKGVFASEGDDPMNFRRLLLQCCQTAYTMNVEKDFVPPEGADEEETFEALLKHKAKMKGNLMFVGTLASNHLISHSVVLMCVEQLLGSRKSLQLEALAAFLPGIKARMSQSKKFKTPFASLLEEVKVVSEDPNIEHRIQCLLKDVIEERSTAAAPSSVGGQRNIAPRPPTYEGFTSVAPSRARFRK